MIFGVFGVYGAINKVVATRLAALNKAAHKKDAGMDSAMIYQRHHRRLMLNICTILSSLFIAAGVFSLIEDWTFARGLYFAVQTATVSSRCSFYFMYQPQVYVLLMIIHIYITFCKTTIWRFIDRGIWWYPHREGRHHEADRILHYRLHHPAHLRLQQLSNLKRRFATTERSSRVCQA